MNRSLLRRQSCISAALTRSEPRTLPQNGPRGDSQPSCCCHPASLHRVLAAGDAPLSASTAPAVWRAPSSHRHSSTRSQHSHKPASKAQTRLLTPTHTSAVPLPRCPWHRPGASSVGATGAGAQVPEQGFPRRDARGCSQAPALPFPSLSLPIPSLSLPFPVPAALGHTPRSPAPRGHAASPHPRHPPTCPGHPRLSPPRGSPGEAGTTPPTSPNPPAPCPGAHRGARGPPPGRGSCGSSAAAR